jgi:hypothetical protein
MSINRHHCGDPSARKGRESKTTVFPHFSAQSVFRRSLWLVFPLAATFFLCWSAGFPSTAQDSPQPSFASPGEQQDNAGSATAAEEKSRRVAQVLANRILEHLTWGPPLEAKLRLRAWAAGREVVEVGRYEQAGEGTGRLRMELQVPIADGKARWQQTCDGRLAWTREELAGEVRVRRVDLGRLEELLASNRDPNTESLSRVPPRLRIGGLAEIVDRIQADYDLTASEGHIEGVQMLVLKGTMRADMVAALRQSHGGKLSPLVPAQVRIAVPVAQLEQPLPARIEFWSEAGERLISLLEIYDATSIEKPPVERFRFEAGGDDFSNETELYVQRFRNP